MKKLKVIEDFNFTTGPRYIREGANSGEEFRINVLYPKVKEAINNKCVLEIDLDGAAGYGTSFLEEAFGGLIRENNLSYNAINSHIRIISTEEEYLIEDIDEYMKDAQNEKDKSN